MKKPKILLWDLEVLRDNTAITADVWFSMSNWPGRTLKGDINTICSFGYKYLGDDKSECINAWDFPGWDYSVNDDGEVVAAGYELLKDADGIVTHNGKSFDLKLFNTRLMIHGFPPLPKIPHVDTKLVAKRHFSFYSNSLNHLAKRLGVETKMGTGSELWDRVLDREESAMQHMSDYCAQDVQVLEQVFLKLRPYMTNIPNYNLFVENPEIRVCPNCGGLRSHKHGMQVAKTNIYQRYQCQTCGTIWRPDKKGKNPRTI